MLRRSCAVLAGKQKWSGLQRLADAITAHQREEARKSCNAPRDFPARHTHVIGIDEAGRGALAGPMVAAAVYIPPSVLVPGLCDSKALTADERADLNDFLWFHPLIDIHVAFTSAAVIDDIDNLGAVHMNLLGTCFFELLHRVCSTVDATLPPHAKRLGSQSVAAAKYSRATAAERPLVAAIVDGTLVPESMSAVDAHYGVAPVEKADQSCPSVAAAAIVAKTFRDNVMLELGELYPEYDFAANKGYETAQHLAAVREHGPSPEHRCTVGAVRRLNQGDFATLRGTALFRSGPAKSTRLSKKASLEGLAYHAWMPAPAVRGVAKKTVSWG